MPKLTILDFFRRKPRKDGLSGIELIIHQREASLSYTDDPPSPSFIKTPKQSRPCDCGEPFWTLQPDGSDLNTYLYRKCSLCGDRWPGPWAIGSPTWNRAVTMIQLQRVEDYELREGVREIDPKTGKPFKRPRVERPMSDQWPDSEG